MKKALGILGVLAFIAGVGFFMFKNRPEGHDPMKVMNPTYFDSESKIGRVISRRFYTHLKDAKFIILGSSPLLKNYSEIWQEFLKASMVDGIQLGSVFTVNGLRLLTKKDQLIEELPKIELGPGLTVLHVPSDETWREKVETMYPQADYIFFQAPFSTFQEGQEKLGLECQSKEDESFRCLALKAGTRYYRKKRNENRLTAMMEQVGLKFYLIFVGEEI